MSISGIFSSNNQGQLSSASSNYQQRIQQLGQDLKSGNLSAAQSDFATLQAAFSQPAISSGSVTGSPSSTSASPAAQAFNQLVSDLQTGNLPAAQKDISTVQQAPQNSNGIASANHPHHYHHISGGERGNSSDQNSLLQELSQVGQSLTSGNLSSTQQAYASLQQQLQQFTLGGGALSTQLPVSFDA